MTTTAFKYSAIAFLLLAAGFPIPANGSSFDQNLQPRLSRKQFNILRECEVAVQITALAPGTSWGKKGAEAAVVTIKVDGQYNQELILFMGAEQFTYHILLGHLSAGQHSLAIDLNRKQSSAGASTPYIGKVAIEPLDRLSGAGALAMEHAPFLFARRNSIGHYTDIPLLMWYEVFDNNGDTTIRYSYVFTNEDAGTATDALMARWGRTTDIEWAYEIKLKGRELVDEKFQAVNHKDTAFKGKKIDGHPLILVASDNNNFADTGDSEMRFHLWPELMDLSKHSREQLMDLHPWTYALATQELYREGKISEAGGHQIRDPRDYVYIEAEAPEEDIGIDLKVRLKDGNWFDSDIGHEYLRITREGWFRVAVRLPEGERAMDAREIALDCHPVREKDQARAADCPRVVVGKVFALSAGYVPHQLKVRTSVVGARPFNGSR